MPYTKISKRAMIQWHIFVYRYFLNPAAPSKHSAPRAISEIALRFPRYVNSPIIVVGPPIPLVNIIMYPVTNRAINPNPMRRIKEWYFKPSGKRIAMAINIDEIYQVPFTVKNPMPLCCISNRLEAPFTIFKNHESKDVGSDT